MNLNDLFEMTPSDVPTYLRRQQGKPDLTMRDIDAQRPKSNYRYMVGDKEFMSYQAALDFSKGTGQPVKTISEQADDEDPKIIGTRFLSELFYSLRHSPTQPVVLPVGGKKYRFTTPEDKKWFLDKYEGYKAINMGDRFLFNLGTPQGFEKILDQFASEHASQMAAKPDQSSDINPQRQGDLGESQKKNEDLAEDDIPSKGSARTKRLVQKYRQRQPQAKSDVEALAYELQAAERRDKQEIDKLERETGELEKNIKQDLQQTAGALKQQRERTQAQLRAVQGTNVKQDEIIKRLQSLDQEQQREIDRLAQAPAGQEPQAKAEPAPREKETKTVVIQPGEPTKKSTPIRKQSQAPRPQRTTPMPQDDEFIDVTSRQAVPAPTMATANQMAIPGIEPANEPQVRRAAESAGAKTEAKKPTYVSRSMRAFAPPKVRSPKSIPSVPAKKPEQGPEVFGSMVKQLTQPASSTGGTVTPTATGLIHQAAQPAAQQPASNIVVPQDYKSKRPKTLTWTGQGPAPAWFGQAIAVGGQTITPRDPNYMKIAQGLAKGQAVAESFAVVANHSLFENAMTVAMKKFKNFDSPVARDWANKWYANHGGTWKN